MDAKEIYAKTTRHFLRPVVSLLEDPSVSEVLINGPETIYFERAGKLSHAEGVRFPSEAALMAAARNIAEYAGRSLAHGEHSMDARLPDGSRVHVILPPSSRVGVCISIRKFSQSSLDLDQLVQWGTLSAEAREFLAIVVKLHRNIVIAGGTGSGKTSLLNALSSEISPDERIVVIEDSSELQLTQAHTIYLEGQPSTPDGDPAVTIRDLFVDSLRMRPDRIIVGEVRRGEALDLVQSMISGHSGAMTTVHATTARDAAIRLETLSMMGGVNLPVHVARVQVASAIHLVLQIMRFPDGKRRVHAISECLGLDEQGEYRFQDIYRLQMEAMGEDGQTRGTLEATGAIPSFSDQVGMLGLQPLVKRTRNIFPAPL
ncbi:CpaF family protein [Aureliella helgolandensis]|uniref:Conjugal transfer protein n=1 Tax=Aureliella helgolandensis TaxID=2527968 RepID=A0A518G1B3_9BACT|nr:ATPase, T2SS/T4P/T4SS family [Aureliella helgolandensis]QDV22330.1 Putative conjugal transfer protein [Aureliella helgolandensis]